MSKHLLTALLFFVIFSLHIQSQESQVKYISLAPDGSTAITITDDFNENTLKLEAADSFYKYQLLDITNSEAVLSSSNRGKACAIDKSAIESGTYYLRLFTKNFIITTRINLAPTSLMMNGNSVATFD